MKTGVKKIIYIDGIQSKQFKNTKSSNLTAEAVKHPTSLDDFQPIAGPSLSPCPTAQDCHQSELLDILQEIENEFHQASLIEKQSGSDIQIPLHEATATFVAVITKEDRFVLNKTEFVCSACKTSYVASNEEYLCSEYWPSSLSNNYFIEEDLLCTWYHLI